MPRIITPAGAYKQLQRYRQVVSILTKYGFGEFFSQIRIWKHINIDRKLLRNKSVSEEMSTAQRLRLALEELGPTFVKMGQMLSTRPDILPPSFISELEHLQNRVSPFPAQTARSIIESELQKPISEIFSTFNDQPLAAASLAQVHRARINEVDVVVKVQRPGIAGVIEVDLEIMQSLASLIERYFPVFFAVNPSGLVKEFAESIRKELDFCNEAANMRRFASDFAGTSWLHVPELYPEGYCTQKVLVMEHIEGIHVSEIDRLKKEGYDLKQIARHGTDIAFRSTLEYGFFHADPHPGNLVILPGNIICLLDYGMMGTLSDRSRQRLGKLIYYVVSRDEKRTAQALLNLMESRENISSESLEAEVSDTIEQLTHRTLGELRLGNTIFKLMGLLQEHQARFPSRLIWLTKAIATIEDVAHKLDPEFNMLEEAKPYVTRFVARSLNPFAQVKESYLTLVESLELIKDLPSDLGVIVDQLKKGRVKIEFEHIGLEPIRKTLNRMANRLAVTLILAAIIIATALIIVADLPPKVAEIPLVGIAGFGIAIVLAAGLMLSILFHK